MLLINKPFQEALPSLPHFKMIFADPPDNIGLQYETYSDRIPSGDYEKLLEDTLFVSYEKCDILWVSFNASHLPLFGSIVERFLAETGWEFKACVQVFTFGQHNQRDFGNNHRPLWRFSRPGAKFYPDAARVPSWRQLNGDKRADPRGRVPGDCFDFPRVVGNSKQRRSWHPTQIHEGLYRRCLAFSCLPGDRVCDIYAGTGTMARTCKQTSNPCTLIETDESYCKAMALEHNLQYQPSTNTWSDSMPKPKDFRGREIYEGAILAYPVRKGSSMWLTEIRVCRIFEEELPHGRGSQVVITGANKNGRRVRLLHPERSVVLSPPCSPAGL